MLSRIGLRATRALPRSAQPARSFAQSTRQSAAHSGHETKLEGVYDNAFNRERAAVKQHAADTAGFWRRLSIYIVVPSLILAAANTWVQWNEHWEHQSHLPPPSERPQYSYMNIRSKAYPWGNGDKTLFWNDKYNYSPNSDKDE